MPLAVSNGAESAAPALEVAVTVKVRNVPAGAAGLSTKADVIDTVSTVTVMGPNGAVAPFASFTVPVIVTD
jgi:hypothetical protein